MEKIETRNWRDVKARRDAERPDRSRAGRVAKIQREQLSAVRAVRLAELRKQQGLTQTDVADSLAVAQSRISAIENGELNSSQLGTISAYVEALGGHLRVVADFGDQTITVE
jgi:predicted XRE-type DNA-binding protein